LGGSEGGTVQKAMSYPVIIRPEAEVEIRGMHEFYGSISEELGDDARDSVAESIDRIQQTVSRALCVDIRKGSTSPNSTVSLYLELCV
jgi:hypothetical protein